MSQEYEYRSISLRVQYPFQYEEFNKSDWEVMTAYYKPPYLETSGTYRWILFCRRLKESKNDFLYSD